MLIRIKGGIEGIAEYLINGQKQDRELLRDELDERVILDGDLELTDSIINRIEKNGERYLHITLSFKEDTLDNEVLNSITSDFKRFAMAAYHADEFNFYAEAHLPKIKSYTNRQSGEFVERKPHIHIVIPEQNLLTGQSLNPFGRVDQQTKFLEAFQEHANARYGLASPKDNRRLKFTNESEIISRYKGDIFHGSEKALKERILSDILDRKISDYDRFKSLLAEYGATRTRNAGKKFEYQNVKPAHKDKGINLKDFVFSREFIEKTELEKRQFLIDEGRKQYESQHQARPPAPELVERLQEWREVRAHELKYINSGNRKLYAAYRAADRDEKRAILSDRADRFYAKHKEIEYDRIDSRRTVANIADNLRAAGRNIESTGRVVGNSKQACRNLADRRASRAVAALGRRLSRDKSEDRQLSRAARLPRDRLEVDNVTGQLLAEARERNTKAKAARLAEFAQIKRELDARRLLAHLSRTHGVIPEKYEVTKGKDGGDRIKAGARHLNVSDFLTQELHLSFGEATPILRQVYAAQQDREFIEAKPEPRRDLWEAFLKAQPDQAKQMNAEWDAQRQSEKERRTAIRDDYQAERRALLADRSKSAADRKAAMSILRMGRVTQEMALREAIGEERQQLKEKHRKPYRERYRDFLVALANEGDENALAELRRQRDAGLSQTADANTIESSEKRDQAAQLARNMAYSIDRSGNVTYYSDQAKRRALIVDSGRCVTVAADKDSQAVETGLRLAVQKFGLGLKIDGSDEFKRQLIDAALNAGLRVEFSNKEMDDELQRRRAERDELQARGKAFIASEREKAGRAKGPEKAPDPGREQQPATTSRKSRGIEL